ncbi:MAG: CBS domain-containing protein [Nitrospirales bacterium]
MTTQGIAEEGLTTIGQIVVTNTERFHPWRNGESVAIALLSSHAAGAPVVDDEGQYLGFINECDVLRTLTAQKDLTKLTAKDIMRRDLLTVSSQTNIHDDADFMEAHRVVNLPVEENGVIVYSISRHDLLRANLGISLDMGLNRA